MTTYHIADQLGALQAQIATLREQEQALKKEITESLGGSGSVEGTLYRVTVSQVSTRRIDWRAVAEYLKPSRQLLQAHSSVSESVRVAVKARLTDKRAA